MWRERRPRWHGQIRKACLKHPYRSSDTAVTVIVAGNAFACQGLKKNCVATGPFRRARSGICGWRSILTEFGGLCFSIFGVERDHLAMPPDRNHGHGHEQKRPTGIEHHIPKWPVLEGKKALMQFVKRGN